MRVTKTLVSRVTAAVLFALVLLPLMSTSASAATRPWTSRTAPDALVKMATADLNAFSAWLLKNNVSGYVGEVGWPSDDPRWNVLAEQWYKRADAANLPVTTWVAGEWAGGHQLSGYARSTTTLGSPLDTVRTNALVAESHFRTTTALRGVNVTGPEMGTPAIDATSTFSNINVGEIDHTYHYDSAATYQYLASRGVRSVRIPFRWERVQRSLFGPLDPGEMSRLAGVVHAASAAGIQVTLDMHNYAGYYLADPVTGSGIRRSIGSAELPINSFTDVWGKLANYFAGDKAVAAYDLMNEPVGMQARGKITAARVWEQASQQALNVIRATGDTRTVMVPGYEWSSMVNWAKNHPSSWIKDPAHNFSYEAHQYFDARRSGVYGTYDAELAAVNARA